MKRYQVVVVYGPRGSGKTLNKQAIADHFGCSMVYDGEPIALQSVRNVRILSLQPDMVMRYRGDGLFDISPIFYHVNEVKELLGCKWVYPPISIQSYDVSFRIMMRGATPQEAADKAWEALKKVGNPTAEVSDDEGESYSRIVGEQEGDQE